MRSKWIGVFVTMVLLGLGAATARAQADIPEVCALKGTILIQNTNSTFNTNTTAYNYPAPTVVKFTTKELLALIAKAENVNGNFSGTNFPSGAKLIKFGTDFTVWDSANNPLLDSDITFVIGFNDLDYGVFTATGTDDMSTPGTETDYGVANIYIYDLDLGGVTDLTYIGSVLNTIRSTAVNQGTGMFTSSQAFTVKAGGGTGAIGNNDDENAVITGSFSAKGTGQSF